MVLENICTEPTIESKLGMLSTAVIASLRK